MNGNAYPNAHIYLKALDNGVPIIRLSQIPKKGTNNNRYLFLPL